MERSLEAKVIYSDEVLLEINIFRTVQNVVADFEVRVVMVQLTQSQIEFLVVFIVESVTIVIEVG